MTAPRLDPATDPGPTCHDPANYTCPHHEQSHDGSWRFRRDWEDTVSGRANLLTPCDGCGGWHRLGYMLDGHRYCPTCWWGPTRRPGSQPEPLPVPDQPVTRCAHRPDGPICYECWTAGR